MDIDSMHKKGTFNDEIRRANELRAISELVQRKLILDQKRSNQEF
jgi:hypothetical protein